MSESMTELLEEQLEKSQISFSQLSDRGELLAALQEAMAEPLRQKLLQNDCSGAFVLLDTTINGKAPEAEYSKTGLYLKRNGYDQNDSELLLYRGIAEVARAHDMVLHRKWRLEFHTDMFPDYEAIMPAASVSPKQAYRITEPFQLPGTSEAVILLTVPLIGEDDTCYGICGYEISASFFSSYHEQPSLLAHLSCLLVKRNEKALVASEAFSCGRDDGYFHTLTEDYTISKINDKLSLFLNEDFSYLGLMRPITLAPGELEHMLVVMIPKTDYDRMIGKDIALTSIFLVLLIFFTVSVCKVFSRRFLAPLLTALEQIKSDRRSETGSDIPEILELIEYLDRQEKAHDEKLITLEKENQAAEKEKQRMQTEIERLAYSRKTEIDPEDYRYFLAGLQTLTETERRLFEYYVSGKSAKEILELTGIKESTLKFHNHNLLGKLGVSSRKQMLRYAEIMAHGQGTE